MNSLIRKTSAFVSELRRRRVFRVMAAYVVVGFAVASGAEYIFDLLAFPLAAARFVAILVLLGLPITLVLAWAFDVTPEGIVRTEPLPSAGGEGADVEEAPKQEAPEREPPDYPRESVAVLPFTNLSDDPDNQYFADGITEDITALLCKVRSLKVVSRTSAMRCRPGEQSVREIAHQLCVGSVLDGSVRRSGTRVRVVAQLIDTRTDTHLWAENFDRDLHDIFAIQTEVSEHIVEALEAELSPRERSALETPPTTDLDAYDLYLQGRYHWNQRTEESLEVGLDFFRKALEADPGFALAHSGMAEALATLGLYNARPPGEVMPAAMDAGQAALELNPDLGEAHAALGCARGVFDWNWAAAEEEFLKAVGLSPGYVTGHHWYALQNLAPQGRFQEARAALKNAGELDPLSPVIRASLGFLQFLGGDYAGAVETLRGVLQRDPEFAMAHYFLAETFGQMGHHPEAMRAVEHVARIRGRTPETISAHGRALALAGRREEAEVALAELGERSKREYVSPTRIAQISGALGDTEAAFESLEKARGLRATDLMWVKVHPAFNPLRGDSRLSEIQEEMGLS